MRRHLRQMPADLDWTPYRLEGDRYGEPLLRGHGWSAKRDQGAWRHDNVTLHYGDESDWNLPFYDVISAPHLGETALRGLHSGLGQAGFVFGMSGTGHVSGAPVPPEATTVYVDGAPVGAEIWRGDSAEVAWITTADAWVAVVASKATLADLRLTRIVDLGPLFDASEFGRFPH